MSKEDELKSSLYEKLPSRNLIFVTFIVTLGSAFHNGYHLVIVNVSHVDLTKKLSQILRLRKLSELADSIIFVRTIWALINVVYSLGGALGAIIAGSTMDKHNRLRVIFVACGLTILADVIMTAAFYVNSVVAVIVARLLMGILSGVFSCAVPIYLTEIAPVPTRGMVCSCYTIMQAAGIVAAFVCGNIEYFGEKKWIVIIMAPSIPVTLQFLGMHYCRPSPRLLLIKKMQYRDAMKSLKWFRRSDHLDYLAQELDEMSKELQNTSLYNIVPQRDQWCYAFRTKYIRKRMMISILMMCAQQLSGIHVVGTEPQSSPTVLILFILYIQFLCYSTVFFEDSGLSSFHARAGTIAIGAAFLFMSIVSMLLVEISGRRMLLLYGYVGTFIFLLLHYLTYMYNEGHPGPQKECVGAVAALFVWYFIIHYALGPSSIPWIIIPEMFNQVFRSKAVTIAACCYWLSSSMMVSFLPLAMLTGPHALLINLISQVIFFFLLYKYVPETSNKTITEVIEMLM